MDYLRYWSLTRRPFFGDEHDPIFFAGVPQREAIAGLNYFVASQMGSAVLVAPAGCGMTSLLRFARQMRGFGNHATEVIVTSGDYTHQDAVLAALCQALGYDDDRGERRQHIERAFAAAEQRRVKIVWMIDRCNHIVGQAALEWADRHAACTVVIGIVNHSWGCDAAKQPEDRAMRISLHPLSVEDTIEYLRYGLAHAGLDHCPFSDNAAVRLHELTGGVLAQLAVLSESSLALAANHRMREVTPAMIESIDVRPTRAA